MNGDALDEDQVLAQDGAEPRFHIFDDALPNPIRFRHLIGAVLGTEIIFTVLISLVLLIAGKPSLEAWGWGLKIAGVIGAVVGIGFWLVPLASCVCETIALRRITPGVLYKVTPTFMTSYGFAAVYAAYLGLAQLPAFGVFLRVHGLEGWRLYGAMVLLGFLLGWTVRHVLLWFYGKPLFREAASLFDEERPDVNGASPMTAAAFPELRSSHPLRVPRFPDQR
jgi:hypothetical protein